MTTESNQYDEQEIEIEAIGIEVSVQPIELYKVMKIANLVGGGGEAKHAIGEGYVAVNGELETRKRRKLYDGDFFEFNQEYYVVLCDAPVTEPIEKVKAEKPAKSAQKAEPIASKAKAASKKPARSGSHSATPAKRNKGKSVSTAKKSPSAPEKRQPSRDPNSGRNSIDFF